MMDEIEERASYNFEQFWAMARRGRWWILLPLFICWLTVWVVSWFVPATYVSEASILVEQQKVPEQYVLSNVTLNLQERLQSMTQQILSRDRLQTIIDKFHLYPAQRGLRKLLEPGDPVEEMRKDIKIELIQAPGRQGDLTAFKIYYSADAPELAQSVNSELTHQFLTESINSQQQLSSSTTTFFDDQLEDARKNLKDQEEQVRNFKALHLGDLPSQLQSNVEILSGLQAQQQSVQHAMDSAKQQRLYLQSQLQQLQTAQMGIGGDAGLSQFDSLQKQLADLRNDLANERARHTEDYPDIVALKGKIAETEKLLKDLGNSASKQNQDDSSAASGTAPADVQGLTASSPLMQIRSQLKANELEIKNDQKQLDAIDRKIAEYRSRLNLTPETEQKLAEVSRGYEEAMANYNSLLQKKNQSQLATELEKTQGGQHFRLLDPASLPDKPKSPNHLLLSLAGLAIGGLLGVGLLALRELMNARVRREDDIDGVVPGRVLVRIPHLDTPREARTRTASRLLEAVAVVLMTLLVVAGNLYSFYKG